MTTLAKIEANQRNGQLSTGLQTAEGKAIVARNATKHGIFAAVPVIPGEDPTAWEAHRAGVVASLAPVGLLEVNLAERAALLLWRLQRLARYEAETVTASMEAVEVPELPPPEDPQRHLFPSPRQKTREEQLCDIREELRKTRRALAEVVPARDFFAGDAGAEETVPFAVVEEVLAFALGRAETAENVRGDPPWFDSKTFLKRLGLASADAKSVTWTRELVHRAIAVYSTDAQEPAEQFVEAVLADLEESAEENERKVRRLERDEVAVVRLLDGAVKRKHVAQQLPTDGREERIAKYERHLHSLLTSTLHELERLQARREGETVSPPAVADVTVTMACGVG